MKRQLLILALVLSLTFLLPLNFAFAQGRGGGKGVSVPVSGTIAGGAGKFVGTLNILRFAAKNGGVVAVGTISGTATDTAGNVIVTGLQTVALPVTLASGPVAAAPAGERSPSGTVKFMKASLAASEPEFATTAAMAAAAQASCEILRLSIGAIHLDLLGLVVDLNPVLLVITAQPGPGNLLGNLLCAIVNLLNPQGPLTQLINLLNQLLALLG